MQLTWLAPNERIEVKKFYRQHMPYARLLHKESICVLTQTGSTSANGIEITSSAISCSEIVASARIRPIGQLAILTGMLVHPDYRGQGVGHRLMRELSPVISDGSTYIFALAHLEEFYSQHGVSVIADAPNDIAQLFLKYQSSDKELVLMGLAGAIER
ncbi:GCN5-related N-acetyltransferase [Shewanella halifaxensis HAW-EB4]|uniref:GCN5-related N-acetyltransferase n=1 Tax=Shewanella halifaxensis (strain HAW-EB4) TaxID=458817 RepID=B0TUB4_SHEHH|nr:GNAT family N-acetyltransferase [Shewanella halifaxensis]ABZ75414.1 GCN5-related N-acetyltransferase [Shewanella halifaxensis HAW-EB4]